MVMQHSLELNLSHMFRMLEERHHLNGMNSRINLGTMDDLKSMNSSLYENK